MLLWKAQDSRNYKTPYFVEDKRKDKGVIHLELAEDVSFLNKASIMNSLKLIPEGSNVIVDGSRTIRIDHDVLEMFEEFKELKEEFSTKYPHILVPIPF